MKNTILTLFISSLLFRCNSEELELDLSTINFANDSKVYALSKLASEVTEQNGHFEIVYQSSKDSNASLIIKDDGEKVVVYQFDDKSGSSLNYSGLLLDKSLVTKIVDYNGKVSFISTSIVEQNTIELVKTLETKLGKPSEFINNERMLDIINPEVVDKLIEAFPNNTEVSEEDKFFYPETIIWNKNDVIFQLTINPYGDKMTNTLIVISKKALKDKIIMGFHNSEKDPILSKYLD